MAVKAAYTRWFRDRDVECVRFNGMTSADETDTIDCQGARLIRFYPPYMTSAPAALTTFTAFALPENRLEVSNPSWDESSKTVTRTNAFVKYVPSVHSDGGTDDYLVIPESRGVRGGLYRVASRTDGNSIVLVNSLSESGADVADLGECRLISWGKDGALGAGGYIGLANDIAENAVKVCTVSTAGTVTDLGVLRDPPPFLRFFHNGSNTMDFLIEIVRN